MLGLQTALTIGWLIDFCQGWLLFWWTLKVNYELALLAWYTGPCFSLPSPSELPWKPVCNTTLGPQCHQSAVLQAKLDQSLCLGCSIMLGFPGHQIGGTSAFVRSTQLHLLISRPNREVGEAADQWMVCRNCLHRQDIWKWASVSVIHKINNITQIANLPDEFLACL